MLSGLAYGDAGDLDPTFGVGGIVTTDLWGSLIGDTDQLADLSLAYQADGKIIAIGRSRSTVGTYDFAVVRYLADGSLDPTFGNGGIVLNDFLGTGEMPWGVVVQPDGRIVVAGTATDAILTNPQILVARYLTDGTLDPSFDGDGFVVTDITPGREAGQDLALQPDGRLVVAGNSGGAFALLRYLSDGSLDPSFGTGGVVLTDMGADRSSFETVKLQPDGRILAAGSNRVGSNMDFAIARYEADGSLDSSFGAGGIVLTDAASGFESARDLELQPDGKLLVSGYSSAPGNNEFIVQRYLSDGTLDPSFGVGGIVNTEFSPGSSDSAGHLAYQLDGRIVVVGMTIPSGVNCESADFAIARYNSDGSLDASFGVGGLVITDVGGYLDSAVAVAIQPDGRILVGGFAQHTPTGGPCNTNVIHPVDFALVRYEGVLQPNLALEYLIDQIEAIAPGVGQGPANSLLVKIQGAIQKLDSGQDGPAVNMLQAFINATQAFIDTGKLAPSDNVLIVQALAVITLIQT